jgi:hypothetical protein
MNEEALALWGLLRQIKKKSIKNKKTCVLQDGE